MSLESVIVGNFKGIAREQEFAIKPITILVGANSSGKSSFIHALAALNQSVFANNDRRVLVLDGETAKVHLGGFSDVIHSRNEADEISLGARVSQIHIPRFTKGASADKSPEAVEAKCVMRFAYSSGNDEIIAASGDFEIGKDRYLFTRKDGKPLLTHLASGSAIGCEFESGMNFDLFGYLARNEAADAKKFQLFFAQQVAQQALVSELRSIRYLGPFRQAPLRRYSTYGADPSEVGPEGSATATLLGNAALKPGSRPKLEQISRWLSMMGLGRSIKPSRISKSDLVQIDVEQDAGEFFSVSELGFGVSQVLPVLTQCAFANPKTTLLFEQPEIHVHPLAARSLAHVFCDAVKEKSLKCVIETHAPELVGEFQRLIRDEQIRPEDVIIYHVVREGGASVFKPVTIDEMGEIYRSWKVGWAESCA